jgi:hypothetical protein
MLTDQELKTTVETLPGERITDEYIQSRIKETEYVTHGLTTVCFITLDNGFKTTGESTPADPINFRKEVGETYAYKQAYQKLWPFFGFLLVEKRYRQ